MENLIEIGYIKKPKGLKGEVFVVLHGSDPSFLSVGDGLKLGSDKNELIITSLKNYKEGFLFTFEGVSDRNQSEALKGVKLYISSELAESFNSEEEVFLATLIGYQFYNFDKQKGVISGFSETKAHDLIQITLEGNKRVEVPWVESFIKAVDHNSRSVYFEAPVELLDPDFLDSVKK